MKRMLATITVAIGLIGATALMARSAEKSSVASVRWIGAVVSGLEEKGIVGGPFPKADPNVEIGLRDDGVVVWRKRQK